ncbi:MAG: hypothetical protein M1817_001128 [Caeruleum heppii]|nr:MAG: hypothetical protein M1817_001128 [Caeruleum heppii]
MPYSYERVERGRRPQPAARSAFGYWVPLIITATVATAGIAAWIWSERRDNDSYEEQEDDRYRKREAEDESTSPGYGSDRDIQGRSSTTRGGEIQMEDDTSSGLMARMSGAIRRSPSPQQMLDGASKRVVAGVAAAGAAVGGALSSIREEDKDDYGDHSRWSEEADSRHSDGARDVSGDASRGSTSAKRASMLGSTGPTAASSTSNRPNARRKTVVVVISAESDDAQVNHDESYHREEASTLSHLIGHVNHATTRLFVLIYAPQLKQHPRSASKVESLNSSYSNIGHDDARSPAEEGQKLASDIDIPDASTLSTTASPAFNSLLPQAQALVEKDTMILPFTTPTGHVHILRHLAPEIVYVQESLSGHGGDAVAHISGWVGQVLVVVGTEGGHGGLVDSEDEVATDGQRDEKWWQHSDRVGLGKGVEVVEGMRIREDWGKRVGDVD